jgi:hypothetical protein
MTLEWQHWLTRIEVEELLSFNHCASACLLLGPWALTAADTYVLTGVLKGIYGIVVHMLPFLKVEGVVMC